MRVFSIVMMILGLSILSIACGEPADDAATTDEVVADSAVVEETAPVVEVNIDIDVDSMGVVIDSLDTTEGDVMVDVSVVVDGDAVVEEVVEEPAPEVTQ